MDTSEATTQSLLKELIAKQISKEDVAQCITSAVQAALKPLEEKQDRFEQALAELRRTVESQGKKIEDMQSVGGGEGPPSSKRKWGPTPSSAAGPSTIGPGGGGGLWNDTHKPNDDDKSIYVGGFPRE
eukprot:12185951-Heterocapsa_arctica.AAC.1